MASARLLDASIQQHDQQIIRLVEESLDRFKKSGGWRFGKMESQGDMNVLVVVDVRLMSRRTSRSWRSVEEYQLR